MKRKNARTGTRRRIGRSFVALLLIGTMGIGCDNFLGLEDWQRDLLGLGLGGIPDVAAIAIALLTGGPGGGGPAPDPIPGAQGVPGPQGDPGNDGADGADGANTQLFHVFIDDFFNTIEEGTFPDGELQVVAVLIGEPVLGDIFFGKGVFPERVAFRTMIPPSYGGANPVTLRLSLLRLDNGIDGEFSFEIFGRRLKNGDAALEDYINPAGAPQLIFTPTAPVTNTEFMTIDIPITVPVPNGMGGGALAAGDFLAFELMTTSSDAGEYLVLGAEFYETTAAPPISGGTIANVP